MSRSITSICFGWWWCLTSRSIFNCVDTRYADIFHGFDWFLGNPYFVKIHSSVFEWLLSFCDFCLFDSQYKGFPDSIMYITTFWVSIRCCAFYFKKFRWPRCISRRFTSDLPPVCKKLFYIFVLCKLEKFG